MNIIEAPRFPDEIAFWLRSGPAQQVSISQFFKGKEQRNLDWKGAECIYDLAAALRVPDLQPSNYGVAKVINYFRDVKAQLNGFRLRDFSDYTVAEDGTLYGSEGVLKAEWSNQETGLGEPDPITPDTDLDTYLFFKQYVVGCATYYAALRRILKPYMDVRSDEAVDAWVAYAGTFTGPACPQFRPIIYVNGTDDQTWYAYGVGSDWRTNYTVDAQNGAVLLQPWSKVVIDTIPSATLLNTIPVRHHCVPGDQIILYGFTGGWTANNGKLLTVVDSPSTDDFQVQVSGGTVTGSGGYPGGAEFAKHMQPGDVLTWSGRFDVPVRLDMATMKGGMTDGGLYAWEMLKLIELLEAQS